MTTDPAAPVQIDRPPENPDIPATVRRLRATFATGRTRSVQWRKEQLRALGRMLSDNETAIAAALEQDLGR